MARVGVEGLEGLIGKLQPTLYMGVQCCPHLVVDYYSRGEIELVEEGVL